MLRDDDSEPAVIVVNDYQNRALTGPMGATALMSRKMTRFEPEMSKSSKSSKLLELIFENR